MLIYYFIIFQSLEHTSNDVKIESCRSLTWLMQNIEDITNKENGVSMNGK